MKIGDICYLYVYIYICIVRETSLNTKVGGVKCQPFLKRSNHWKRALKIIFKPEAVVTSTAKESLRSTKRGSLQVLTVLETAVYNCNKHW